MQLHMDEPSSQLDVYKRQPLYRESIYRERAICSERVRLAMGLSLRPDDEPVHVTSGLDESNVAEKYYEPPLMQVDVYKRQ